LHQRERPEPPDDLSPAEAETWRNCVRAMEPDWANPATEVLIKLYCTCVMLGDDWRRGCALSILTTRSSAALTRYLRDATRTNNRSPPRFLLTIRTAVIARRGED
jgi:hypothetical protein